MTSLLVGSKSFSFKHKNFQKQTTEDFPFHVCLWLTTIRVTVVHPLPKPLQVTLNYIAQKTAIYTLKQILAPVTLTVALPLWHPQRHSQHSPLDKEPLPLRCRNWQRLITTALPLPKPQRRGNGLGCSSFLPFFFKLQSSISLKHHHSTSKRIPRL